MRRKIHLHIASLACLCFAARGDQLGFRMHLPRETPARPSRNEAAVNTLTPDTAPDPMRRKTIQAEKVPPDSFVTSPFESFWSGNWQQNTASELVSTNDANGTLSDYSMYRVWAYEADAWARVLAARKSGPHQKTYSSLETLKGDILRGLHSAKPADWYFLGIVLVLLVTMDLFVLQQLPETARTNLILLIFWLLVAVVFAMEIWLHIGPESGIDWITGYLMELMFSLDNVFIVHVIISTLETPRRLIAKALSIWLVCSIAFRWICFLGLGSALDSLRVIPYVLGIWLVYCGTTYLVGREDDFIDVTQTTVVRAFRIILGDRLGEFYDEESEATFVQSRGKFCMTLLGVVIVSLVSADFFCGLDVVLTKLETIPNVYLNFSSSALAIFAVRALFFVARDAFIRCPIAKYGVGLVVLFVGAEILLSQAIYINALMSCGVITSIALLSTLFSSFKEPYHKIG